MAVGLGAVVAAVVVLGTLAAVVRAGGVRFPGDAGVEQLFHLDTEFNLPAILAVLGLAAGGVLLLLVSACLRQLDVADHARWRWLGVGFLYLALDEGARIHERANYVVNQLGISLAALRFGWVLLGIVAVLILTPIYLPAVLRLPGTVRLLAIAAAAVFVGGAVGLEMLGATVYERGPGDPWYQAAVIAEEAAELTGIGLFLVALWTWWGHITARTELVHAPSG